MDKNRYFYAASCLGLEAKLFVLSADSHLYSKYLQGGQPHEYSVMIDQETFVVEDFKWADQQTLIELDYATALVKARLHHQHWFVDYLERQLCQIQTVCE